MGKYRVNVTFSLTAELEPDGYLGGIEASLRDEILDYEENATFYAESISVGGGDVWITVEAEDEAEASVKAQDLFETHASWDGDSHDWEIVDVSVYDVEEVKEPMTLRRAMEIVEKYLATLYQAAATSAVRVDEIAPRDEVREAFAFILAECMKLRAQEVAHSA